MALSDEEQRLLEQMEAALAAEDPKLVNTLRGTGARRVHRRRAALAGHLRCHGDLFLAARGQRSRSRPWWRSRQDSTGFPPLRRPGFHGQDGGALASPA